MKYQTLFTLLLTAPLAFAEVKTSKQNESKRTDLLNFEKVSGIGAQNVIVKEESRSEITIRFISETDLGDRKLKKNILSVQATGGTIFGSKGTVELYKGYTLKNDWKVKSVQIFELSRSAKGGYKILTPIKVGSNVPYLKLRIWEQGGFRALTEIGLQVTIEGPADKNPYE